MYLDPVFKEGVLGDGRLRREYILRALGTISQCHGISFCRYMLGLAAIPAVIQFLGFLFLPESPRWLIQKGQTQKARRILSQMRGNQTIDEEYDSIRNSIEEEEKDASTGMCTWRCGRRRRTPRPCSGIQCY